MKRSKIKVFVGRVVEFPGAFVALSIYAGFAVCGKTKGAFGLKLRNTLLIKIPIIATGIWLIAIITTLITCFT